MDKTTELARLLREQNGVFSWYKNYELFDQAADRLLALKADLSVNNEFFSGQLERLNKINLDLEAENKKLKGYLKVYLP